VSKCTGIIVEDDTDMAFALEQYMELEGIKISGKATDGEKGYQLFLKLKPKFVILDMKMPKYDGAYAIKKN